MLVKGHSTSLIKFRKMAAAAAAAAAAKAANTAIGSLGTGLAHSVAYRNHAVIKEKQSPNNKTSSTK